MSTWLSPGQSVSWTTTGTHSFSLTVTAGVEAEAGVVMAKAKTSLNISVAGQWSTSTSHSVSDTNNTKKGYRAVLGNTGYKLTWTKEWYSAPCQYHETAGSLIAPRPGGLSIGRYAS